MTRVEIRNNATGEVRDCSENSLLKKSGTTLGPRRMAPEFIAILRRTVTNQLEALQALRKIERASQYPIYLDSRRYGRNAVMFLARTRTGLVKLGWAGWHESPGLYEALVKECRRLRGES